MQSSNEHVAMRASVCRNGRTKVQIVPLWALNGSLGGLVLLAAQAHELVRHLPIE